MTEPPKPARDLYVTAGMTITAIAAAVSSFTGLRSLAAATGWPSVLAPLFPLCIDAYAATSTRVWLSGATRSGHAQRFAKWNAILAIGLSLVGNGAWHLLASQIIRMSWVIVVLVGAVPPAVLGLLSHLAVLRSQPESPAAPPATAKPRAMRPADPAASTKRARRGTRRRAAAATIETARAADERHREQHGRPISRDELRRQLHTSAQRATELLRQLKAEGST